MCNLFHPVEETTNFPPTTFLQQSCCTLVSWILLNFKAEEALIKKTKYQTEFESSHGAVCLRRI